MSGDELTMQSEQQVDWDWSTWLKFPDPRNGELLTAPFGAGCYELREGTQLVLFGMGGNVAHRMTSLLPAPHGCGTRNNAAKREYVFEHLPMIEYRTVACRSIENAKKLERTLKGKGSLYLFGS